MKALFLIQLNFWLSILTNGIFADETAPQKEEISKEEFAEQIRNSVEELAEVQDELAADVMELVESQTVPQVIELLEEVEVIMAEVTDDLIETETGGATMAAQTEIIEKILAAAKKKKQSSEGKSKQPQDSSDAMLNMMERMLGREPGAGEGEGPPQGQKPGEGGSKGGEGSTGDSGVANESVSGSNKGQTDERVIPKGSAPSGQNLPDEFRKLLDAYNSNRSPNS